MQSPVPQKSVWPLVLSYAGAVAALVLFQRLANEISEGDTVRFDTAVRTFVHSFASPGMTILMKAFTTVGNMPSVLCLTIAASLVLWFYGRRRGTVLLPITVSGAVLLMFILKLIFHRQRPDPYFGLPTPRDFSFPSGHALVAFCFWGVLAVMISTEQRRLASRIAIWCLALCMVVGIGLSRIYLGVHYPSDVAGGYLAGIVWVSGVGWVYRRYRRRHPESASLSE